MERISKPEYKSIRRFQRRRKKEKSFGRRTKGTEACIFKLMMSKNFSKLMTDTKPQTQKTQRISREG